MYTHPMSAFSPAHSIILDVRKGHQIYIRKVVSSGCNHILLFCIFRVDVKFNGVNAKWTKIKHNFLFWYRPKPSRELNYECENILSQTSGLGPECRTKKWIAALTLIKINHTNRELATQFV